MISQRDKRNCVLIIANIARGGADIRYIQMLLGHKDLKTAHIYSCCGHRHDPAGEDALLFSQQHLCSPHPSPSLVYYMRVEEMTSPAFKSAVETDPVVIIPVGALEEHGPHLPLATDTIQPTAVIEEAAKRTGALVMPMFGYGLCSSTQNFPGTVSLSFDTMRSFAMDVVKELARNGVRRMIFVSGHAGRAHMMALKEGAKQAVKDVEEELAVLVLSDYDFAYSRGDMEEDDGHAGMLETSRILALRPDLVGHERPACHPVFPRFRILKDASPLFPEGVHGDTARASAEYGQEVNRDIIESLVRLIEETKKTKIL